MSRLAEINKRIQGKLRELENDREERVQAVKVIQRRDATLEDLQDELRKVRIRIKRRRDILADVREDLAEASAATPDTDTAEEAALRERRDYLVGELEEAFSDRNRILARIERMAELKADAKAALERIVKESQEDREALERLRARKKRIQEAQDRPSPHFTWAEFDCNDGTKLPEESKPAVRHWCVNVGEKLVAQYGAVFVTSGFRHRDYNARVGGEDASVHIYNFPGRDHKAVAVDFKCEKGSPRDWYNFTAGKADGRGLYPTFHHADTRNRIGWSDASWVG